MATDLAFIAYVEEQAALGERLSYRKMFGEFALYVDGKVVALACDNSLYGKPLAATATRTEKLPTRPPYPGAKLHPVLDELLDDGDALRALLLATAAALPPPKPKPPRKARKRTG